MGSSRGGFALGMAVLLPNWVAVLAVTPTDNSNTPVIFYVLFGAAFVVALLFYAVRGRKK